MVHTQRIGSHFFLILILTAMSYYMPLKLHFPCFPFFYYLEFVVRWSKVRVTTKFFLMLISCNAFFWWIVSFCMLMDCYKIHGVQTGVETLLLASHERSHTCFTAPVTHTGQGWTEDFLVSSTWRLLCPCDFLAQNEMNLEYVFLAVAL